MSLKSTSSSTDNAARKLPVEDAKPAKMKRMSSGPLAVVKFFVQHFSTVRQRAPPNKMKTRHVRLISIGVSHFCEKTRFVLDLLEADPTNPFYYTEDAHPPGLQAYETLKASNEKVSSTPMVVFVDDYGEEQMIYDSVQINKHFMPELYPSEIATQVEEVERDLGQRLGATVRCFAYYHLLSDLETNHEILVKICADPNKVATVESKLFDKFLEKGLGKGIMKALGVNEESAATSLVCLRSLFAEWSTRLEHSGGSYMMDSKTKSYGLTAADLTFAALAYPLLCPPEMAAWTAPLDDYPLALRDLISELRATRAGQHALKIYAKHRIPGDAPNAVVVMKYADRSRTPFPSWKTIGLFGTLTVVVAGCSILLKRSSK